MRPYRLLIIGFALVALIPGDRIFAQARPSPAQAEALLKARPELVSQIQSTIAGSGLTPEQIRARLRAEGYPEGMLDAYIARRGGETAVPTSDVFDAVRSLGIADEAELDDLMRMAGLSPSTSRSRSASAGVGRMSRDGLRELTDAEIDSLESEAEAATIFGLKIFEDATSLFLPNLDGPVDAGYRLGPGDQLVLILTGDVELAHTLDVTREGFVVIPEVGQIGVANLTLSELENLLYVRLGRAHSGLRRGESATTRFSLSVSKLRSNQIFVSGDVRTPGSYRITSAGTALTALYAAGGPTEQGSLRRVEVRRGGAVVASLDVYDYLLRGDGTRDVRLQQGDFVFVPVHGRRARVQGAVTRPATYELREGETLAELLRAAGGLLASAGGRRVLIERILPVSDRTSAGRNRAVIDVPLGLDGSIPAIAIEDGDVVRVPMIADRVRASVTVKGHVWSEGVQGFTSGLTLEQALGRAGGLKPDGHLSTVHVSRLLADSSRIQLRAALRDTTGAMDQAMLLQDDDEITVYSRTAFRPIRYVSINGAIKNSGRFPWRGGMTLRDLVLIAGGLQDNALLEEAEIARIPTSGDARTTAIAMRVKLDSAYRVEFSNPGVVRSPDVAIEPFDNVLIFRDPNWREQRSVVLTGEVRFPGHYTLTTRADRLSALIARAGGLTAEADAGGAYFARIVDTAQVRLVEQSLSRRTSSDTLDRLDDVRSRIRVGVDLSEAMSGRGRSDDLVLLNGDSVHVPKRLQTVDVRGAVNAPTALAHAGGKNLGYYIDAAGGTTELARSRRAFVVQPNGKIESRRRLLWVFVLDPTPRPGATVVVPERTEVIQRSSAFESIAVVTQLLASLAAIVALSR